MIQSLLRLTINNITIISKLTYIVDYTQIKFKGLYENS